MHLDCTLDIGGPARTEYNDNDDDNTATTTTSEAAESFLKEHPAAKIVIVIDTHCITTGSFVWRGDSPETYEVCTLFEVSATL
jgi:phosphoribosylpyrophosphate synthetase